MTAFQVAPKNYYRLTAAVAAVLGLSVASLEAADFTWKGVGTASWSTATNWTPSTVPSGSNSSDRLFFGGDTGTIYTAVDDIAGVFTLNQLVLNATDTTLQQKAHIIQGPANLAGRQLRFDAGALAPAILQNGLGNFTIRLPITSTSDLLLGGSGTSNATFTTSVVTLDGPLSGVFDITKDGGNTFRFGSLSAAASSGNTWFGTLTIKDGAIRFNNNAYSASTALRSNPVTLEGDAVLSTLFKENFNATPDLTNQDPQSSLRLGTLNGTVGTLVLARREDNDAGFFDSTDIVINTLSSGTFAGTIRNKGDTLASTEGDGGRLVIRGVGNQTFTGTVDIIKDVAIGRGATMTLAGTASLGGQDRGAIELNGGTLVLDNSVINNGNRLRDADAASTGIEVVGGGTLSLIGNAAGTVETVGRLQLGAAANQRSGALRINVTQAANSTGATELRIQSLSRDNTLPQFATVHFSATDSSGAALELGQAGVSPRISFVTAPALGNGGLLKNTGTATNDTIGWATVSRAAANGAVDMDFATIGANGIAPVATQVGFTGATANTNVRLESTATLNTAAATTVASLKLGPTTAGQQLTLSGGGQLNTNAILLAGSTDFTISGTGGSGISGTGPRFFHVQDATLTVSAPINGADQPLVKAGAGTLALTSTANSALAQPVVINDGILRATPGTTLPNGELRLRGGIYEIQGDGVSPTNFTRQLGNGTGKLTWSGLTNGNVTIGQDRGSGGFAAIGSDANVSITTIANGTTLAWEDPGFVDSGHALVFGSRSADRIVNWTSNLQLKSNDPIFRSSVDPIDAPAANYTAREIRVIDNPAVSTDRARISGVISGTNVSTITNNLDDLMKTGAGVLELSATNTYTGATLVHEGTLLVNGTTTSHLTDVRNGATLGGIGTVGAVYVENGGTLAPGELAGFAGQTDDLAINGNLRFEGAGAKLKIELGLGVADQLNVKGSVILEGAELVGSLLNGFTANTGDLFFVIINDGTDAVQGAFAQGGAINIGGQPFEISYAGNFETLQFTGGNDVVLRAVPEPSTALLLGSGLALLGIRRRRK